jgi:hypothetical protein
VTPKSRPRANDEGRALLDAYHGFDQATAEERCSRAIDFRENAIRLILLDFHLAFDDVLKDHLAMRMSGQSAFTNQQDRDYLDTLPAATVIDLASRLGAIDHPTRDDLLALNKLRNTAKPHLEPRGTL